MTACTHTSRPNEEHPDDLGKPGNLAQQHHT
jgi:hypothetical protein